MRRKFAKFESKGNSPCFFRCTVIKSDGSICGEIGFIDRGIDEKPRYPCRKHYLELKKGG